MKEKLYEKWKEVCDFLGTDKIYLVGGACRDAILGNEPKDFDFTTPLSPDEIEELVSNSKNQHDDAPKIYPAGKRFGTIGFKLNGELIEITTFRNESYRKGDRKPDVTFVDKLGEDLMRRDFTFNAMAFRKGKIIDMFNGQEDLKNKVIRYVGNPIERINDDPLRMLRCARFMAKYNLTADSEIYGKTQKVSHKILSISKERIMDEMSKLLLTDNPSVGLDFLMHSGVLRFILPELEIQKNYDQNSRYHDLTLWEHTKAVVEATPKDLHLRWSALLHDIGKPSCRTNKPVFSLDSVTSGKTKYKSNYINHDLLGAEMVKGIALRMKWSNKMTEEIYDIIKTHLSEDNPLKKYDDMSKKL